MNTDLHELKSHIMYDEKDNQLISLNIESLMIESAESPPSSPTQLSFQHSPNTANTILNYNNVSTHTFKKTEWDVKKLENYVKNAYCDHTPMEGMNPQLLNRYLISFFELAKKSDGMDYEPESLIGFMNSFERYLKTKQYPESLLRSDTFKDARTLLNKKKELVRSIGKLIRTKTKDTCYLLQFHRNLLKEKGLLERDTPDNLIAEIYLNNMIYFGEFLKEDKAQRGNLNLVWGDLLLEKDPQNGLEYLTLATYAKKTARNQQSYQTGVVKMNTRTKTGSLSINDSSNAPRVYAQRQPINWCPIEAYKIYRSRRPNNCLDRDSPFYLAPLYKLKNQSKVWYKALAMSCQRLDALFYCLFKKAGVDLNSLANMSQQQQQAIINSTAASSSSSSSAAILQNQTWGSIMKQNHSDEDDNHLINGSHLNESTGVVVPTLSTSNYNSIVNQYQQQIHVPAQIQVQIQVQVPH